MKRLFFCFLFAYSISVSAQIDSLFRDAGNTAQKAIRGSDRYNYKLGREAIQKYQLIIESSYKAVALYCIGEVYYEMGQNDSNFIFTAESVYFDSAEVYYSKAKAIGFKGIQELYYKLAFTQIWLKKYDDAKINLVLAFQLDTTRKFKDHVLIKMGYNLYMLEYTVELANEIEPVESKRKARSQLCLDFYLLAYEFYPGNGKVAKSIYYWSKQAGNTIIQEKFRKILKEEYDITANDEEE